MSEDDIFQDDEPTVIDDEDPTELDLTSPRRHAAALFLGTKNGEDTLQTLESKGGSAIEPQRWRSPISPPAGVPRLEAAGAAFTHPGMVRTNNEDAFMVWPETNVVLVADGMGGHLGGEVASAVTVENIREQLVAGGAARSLDAARQRLIDAIHRAHVEVSQMAGARRELKGMGTTLVGLWLLQEKAVIVHVGDSRLYLLRKGTLKQLTGDHSLAGELYRHGVLDTQALARFPQKHVLTQAIGTERGVSPEATVIPVAPGDRFLLCTDGLSDMLDEPTIRGFLNLPGEPSHGTRMLVEAALAQGGKDNVTVVVVHILELPA